MYPLDQFGSQSIENKDLISCGHRHIVAAGYAGDMTLTVHCFHGFGKLIVHPQQLATISVINFQTIDILAGLISYMDEMIIC